jgi:arabinofuranosyltransferase
MQTRETKHSRRRIAPRAILLATVGLVALVHALRAFQSAFSDDAFITFRYAKHLAEGSGLRWNRGDAPVEGFTSLLHVLLLSGGILSGCDPLVLSQILGLFGFLLSLLGAAAIGREVLNGDDRPGLLAAFVMSLASSAALWSRGGLETTLFAAALSLAAASWLRSRRTGSWPTLPAVAFFIAALFRPEAVAVAGIAMLHDLFAPRAARSARTRMREAAFDWWPYFVLLLTWAGWKMAYFGSLLPNPWYVKSGVGLMSLRAGVAYVLHFFQSYGAVGLLLAASPLVVLAWPRPAAVSFLMCSLGIWCAYVAWMGGDYGYFSRYLVPFLPMMAALTAAGAILLWDRARAYDPARRVTAAVVILATCALELAAPSLRELRDRPFLLSRPWRLVEPNALPGDPYASLFREDYILIGKALRDHFPRDRTMACMPVGAIGYYSEMPILDLLGINDRRIARLPVDLARFGSWSGGHMKGSAAEVLARKPDYLWLDVHSSEKPGTAPADDIRRKYPFVGDLLDSQEFLAAYRMESCRLPDGRWLNYYRRQEAPRASCLSSR